MSETETHVPAPAAGQGDLVQLAPRGRLEGATRRKVAGFAEVHPNWDGVICLPGDPTHWVHLSAGEVVSFQSFLTARLAAALGASDTPDLNAVSDAMARPERIAGLLHSAELGGNRDEMLGVLMGAELAAAKVYWLGQQVVVLGSSALCDGYETLLQAQGVPVMRA